MENKPPFTLDKKLALTFVTLFEHFYVYCIFDKTNFLTVSFRRQRNGTASLEINPLNQ